MEKQVFNLLREFYPKKMSEKRLSDQVLRTCKRQRKELSRDDVKELGYDIFEKSKKYSIEDVITYALDQGYIAVVDTRCIDRELEIAPMGELFIARMLTNDFCEDYKLYEKELVNAMEALEQPNIERKVIMHYYHVKKNIEDVIKDYATPSHYQKDMIDYHRYMFNLMGKDIEQNPVIFHLNPKLYALDEHMDSKVKLIIDGCPVQHTLKATQQYPNKRYFVAGISDGRKTTGSGYYPLLFPSIDHMPLKLQLTLTWIIDDEFTVIHKLNLEFEKAARPGSFYSTDQCVSRSMRINQFDLRTSCDLSKELWEGRNVQFKTNYLDHIEIEEYAVLSNFPIEMHAAFTGTRHFSNWYSERHEEDERGYLEM